MHEFARTSVRRAPAALACATPDGVRAPGSIAAGSRPVVGSPSLFPWAGRPLAVPGGCERTLLSRASSCTCTAKQGESCCRNAASGAAAPQAQLPTAPRGVRRVPRAGVGHGGRGGRGSNLELRLRVPTARGVGVLATSLRHLPAGRGVGGGAGVARDRRDLGTRNGQTEAGPPVAYGAYGARASGGQGRGRLRGRSGSAKRPEPSRVGVGEGRRANERGQIARGGDRVPAAG